MSTFESVRVAELDTSGVAWRNLGLRGTTEFHLIISHKPFKKQQPINDTVEEQILRREQHKENKFCQ